MHKSSADREDAECKRSGGNEPARAKIFAGHVARQLEDDVADVEGAQDGVVVVAFEIEIFLKSRKSGIAWKRGA
jgi:hypothetical protein